MAKNTDQAFESIRVVGGLLGSKVLQDARIYKLPGQAKEDYGIEPGLSFNDEIGRYWRIAQARWQEYQQQIAREDIASSKLAQDEWLVPLLNKILGFDIQKSSSKKLIGEREFPITHTASNGAVPVVLCGVEFDLDKGDALFGQEGRKRSPMGLVQEYLNAETDCLWAIVSNGVYLRLLRDNPAMTRPAYLEVDFSRLFEEDNFSDFATLWLLLHSTRLSPRENRIENCWLEQWRDKGQDDGERALDRLRYGVADALRQLGTGFVAHPNNTALREKLSTQELTTDAYFQQVLRLVYRFLFLLTAEDRDVALLPREFEGSNYEAARKLYNQGYSVSQLRERARMNRHYDLHGDAWQLLLVSFKGFAEGQPLLAQPALGGLFSADQCAHIEACEIENRYVYSALFNLAYFEHDKTLSRINYRDMDTEEFGSVYESLLELIPQLHTDGKWQFSFIGDAEDEESASGHSRKLTGSYYTPDSLVQELIKSALEPVIKDRLKASPQNPREALLGISVCDPACGSGHFLLAAARRLAAELATIDAGTDQPTEAHYRHAIRDVVRHCIYGVDLNPMAVELCKTGLWLESIEPGKPLSFLDSHIQNGNALVGVLSSEMLEDGIPGDAYKQLTGDDKETCKELRKQNTEAAKKLAVSFQMIPQTFNQIESMPEDTVEQVREKQAAYELARTNDVFINERLKEDIFTAAFFASKTEATINAVPTNAHLKLAAEGQALSKEVLENTKSLAKTFKFLHWPLAFPQIFGAQGKGGFDVMLGNPPWDVSQFEEEKYFSSRSPDIASLPGAKRKAAIEALEKTLPRLWMEYQTDKMAIECQNQFFRIAGRNNLTAKGKLNLYAIFAEHFAKSINDNGRAGVIVPTGIATDDSTKAYFGWLSDGKRLASLYDFENRAKLFDIDSRIKFCLLTLAKNVDQAELAFFATQPHQLSDKRRCFSLTADEFSLINPNTKTCPVFRSNKDAELTKKLYRVAPILVKDATENGPEENTWGVRFSQGLFNMTSASHLFKKYQEFEKRKSEGLLPLYEAKMVHHYDHRWATFEVDGETSRDCTLAEKQDPNSRPLPRYWIEEKEVTLRTASAPKLVIDAAKKGDAESIKNALKVWLAGWMLDTHEGKEDWDLLEALLGKPAKLDGGDMFSSGLSPFAEAAKTTHQQFSLAEAESKNIQQMVDGTIAVESVLWPLLEVRRLKYLLGFRDITNVTNERTVISSVIALSGVGHTLPLVFSDLPARKMSLLLANFNSLPLDFIARQKVGGTHLTFGYVKQFPIVQPSTYTLEDEEFINSRVLELVFTENGLKPFAEDLGYQGEPFTFDPERRHQLKSELDAYYSRLYGLTRDELRYILDPADVMGDDYPSETFRVLKNKEMNEFGEYRTQRLVLEAWDKLEKGELE
ncbi:MAG: N-6 DNA methylase [Pseudomonadales bacterium]|nr:N-6 DNA methylase [Pseudomonadales bacterium]